jgi:hypothetical protein
LTAKTFLSEFLINVSVPPILMRTSFLNGISHHVALPPGHHIGGFDPILIISHKYRI